MSNTLIDKIARLEAEQTFLFQKVKQIEKRIQGNEEKLILLKAARGF